MNLYKYGSFIKNESNKFIISHFFKGERYDFIINAFRKPSSFLIKAKGWADCSVKKVYQTAFLKYHDSFDKDNLPDLNQLNYENASRNGLVKI